MTISWHFTMGGAAAMAALFLLGTAAPAAVAAPKLYTAQQAQKGATVYAQNCAGCHGSTMQGASAPAIAGTAFLGKSKELGWTVENFRHVVMNTMPRSDPGSLSDQQYEDVIAYLLAVDCYPSGQSQFPAKPTAKIKSAQLQEPSGVTPDNKKLGTCKLHQNG